MPYRNLSFRSTLYSLLTSVSLLAGTVFLPAAGVLAQRPAIAPAALPSFAEPAISPDRREVAFVSGGDIWTVPLAGGEARLLVSHPASESRPVYAPDGRRLAFVSNRTGNGDIYVLTLDSGDLRRLTFDDAIDVLNGWSRDGRWVYFHSSSKDISGMNDIHRVSSEGGTPMPITADRYVNEFFSAPSPDGTQLAFAARGNASTQWWRKGHSHLDESEIWVMREGEASSYEPITERGAKEMWAMWSGDGRSLYYVSDRSGAQNLWVKPVGKSGGPARQLTQFKDGRLLFPTISYDGKMIVFERNFAIWKFDTANNQAGEIPVTRRGVAIGTGVERLTLNSQFSDLALSPDGRKLAFLARGDVFAAGSREGGEATRVTSTYAAEANLDWAPDSKRLVYVSSRDTTPHIYQYDFATNTETQLTSGDKADAVPSFSHDGKLLAFQRGGRELFVLDMETKRERLLATGYLESPPFSAPRPMVWSPDNRWIAYLAVGDRAYKNVHVVAVAGGDSRQVSFMANASSNTLSWSADGTYLLFDTGQRTEGNRIARVDLTPRLPKFREDQFRDLFRDPQPRPQQPGRPAPQSQPQTQPDIRAAEPVAPPAPAGREEKKDATKPVDITFDGIRQRLSIVPTGIESAYQAVSPDGKWLLITAFVAGQANLYLYPLDELSREPAVTRQLTTTPGFKSFAQFSPDSKEVFFLEAGRVSAINLDNRQARAVALTAELEVDFARQKMQTFDEAWTLMRDHFYDPNYHGANWTAIRGEYGARVAGAMNADEMRRIINLMVGELNASHLGISGPSTGASTSSVGRLGLRFDRVEYETAGRLKVTEIIPLGPAAAAGNVKIGDYLTAVDGTQVTARTNLDELLDNKANRRVVLAVAPSADGAGRREVVVKPANLAVEKGLLYRDWVNRNRDYVARVSQNRLGYVHIPDMSDVSLNQLYVDLDTENQRRDGVVIDIRNNNGGFVNVYAIDVFARKGYITMTTRGYPGSPMRTLNGQRALELPTVLVTNQHSLSDAEDFTEGYRSLKLGKVVGEPTSGWIIYTWNISLSDGSSFRIPRTRITDSSGQNMELNPRPVDVPVTRPVGETYIDRDSQLDTAARELLKQLGNKR